jgi:hypothetical protein
MGSDLSYTMLINVTGGRIPPNGFLTPVPACELEKNIKRVKGVLET